MSTHPPAGIVVGEASAWTPVPDAIARELGNTAANVFGAVWRFCQMRDGVCRASLRKIADRLNLSPATVSKYIDVLEQAGYLEDMTPKARNRPHMYRDTHKVLLQRAASADDNQVAVEDANSPFDSQTQEGKTVCQAELKIQSSRRKKQDTRAAPDGAATPKAADVPELRLFREVTERYPPRALGEEVISSIRSVGERIGKPPTVDDLRPYWKAWVAKGYRPTDLAWLLEWAVNDAIPTKGGIYGTDPGRRSQQQRPERQQPTEEQEAVIRRINAARSSADVSEMQ